MNELWNTKNNKWSVVLNFSQSLITAFLWKIWVTNEWNLRGAWECYIDGTFKAVSAPFRQLCSIHAFLKRIDNIKQVRLVFALFRLWGCTLVCYPWSNPLHQGPRVPFWCKVQDLAAAYMEVAKTHKFICLLFCLPFLPAEQMQPVFTTILALNNSAILMQHMNKYWFDLFGNNLYFN